MPQHTNTPSRQGSLTEQPAKVSNLLSALDLSTSTPICSVMPWETFHLINAADQKASTGSHHDDGTIQPTLSPNPGVVQEHGVANGSDSNKPAKEVTKGAEDDGLDQADTDLMASYWKLNYGDVYELSFEQRKAKASAWLKHSVCSDILTVERIATIEEILTTKGFMEAETPKKDEEDKKAMLQSGTLTATKLGWFGFTSCDVDRLEPTCFAVLLAGKPIRSALDRSRRAGNKRELTDAVGRTGGTQRIERIQFPTFGATYVLDDFLGFYVPTRTDTILRPFKPLFAFYQELKTRYGFATKPDPDLLESERAAEGLSKASPISSEPQTGGPAVTATQDGSLDDEETRNHNKFVTGHAIVDLIHNDLKDDLNSHLECRGRSKSGILFDDLWHLFFPGDIVYDPKLDQAFQVLCVQNGRTVLDIFSDQPDGNPQVQGTKNPLAILAFSIAFDGQSFGPSQRPYSIDAWEGEQLITSLPIYPIEYAAMGDSISAGFPAAMTEALLVRGRKFCDIVNTPQVAHRQYRGLDIGKVREQIDSDIIVDIGYYFEQNPSDAPEMGLLHPPPGDKREVVDTTYTVDPDKGSKIIFDDRALEAERMTAFISVNSSSLLQRTQVGTELTEARQLLLPRGVWAYVFRNRKWSQLDVNLVQPLEQNHQSFDDLVLQSDHKRLVQSLVKTHSTGTKPTSNSVGTSEHDHREDLVRGKGKGVIILLHGVPGVGKSSTAECVAEYTKRPLLSITCGDIGQSAGEVQTSLELHLNLAHRWGCVMLLDEADVFLAARDKRDLQRNAVVSVFLRVLEYYSGILFLTTNKVGAFDEAFKSRIHLSLYYDKLSADQTWKIWDVNLKRQMKLRPHLSIDKDELLRWGEKNYRQCRRDGTQVWNGRQIRNACQTAAALAEADEKGTMQISHLEAVVKASLEFDKYLAMVYGGDDADRVRRAGEREDSYTTYSRASQAYHDDDRYSDYYRDRDYGYEPPRRASRGPRVFRDERVRDRFDGRGSDREDGRYAERQRSPAEPRERPRV